MPIEGEHYLGIDLVIQKNSCERIMDIQSKWRDIAKAGRKWAFENYFLDKNKYHLQLSQRTSCTFH